MPDDLTHTFGSANNDDHEPSPRLESPPGYELLDEIGRGGMGVVYRARDISLTRDVAVKLLSTRYSAGSLAAQRFLGEARITGQLQHPAIPAVHQVGTLADGRPFLAMKLIKGSTLETILNHRTDLSAERGRMLAIFEALCQAVGYAHAHQVIHRDLKPANVMVGAYGEVQVMDWGLAKILGEESAASEDALGAEQTRAFTEIHSTPEAGSPTQPGSIVGTPAYIPPEQALGEIDKVNARSDVFGLGAILAVILTGKPPYVGDTSESVRVRAARGKLDECFARLDSTGAEPELVALCKKCLAFDPADRPVDAGAVVAAVAGLRAAADERARRAELQRAQSQIKFAEERKRRRITAALASALLALVVVGGLAMALWWYERSTAIREAEAALVEAASHRDAGRWSDARVALERAVVRLGTRGPEDLRARVKQARLDHDLVAELDAIWMSQSETVTGKKSDAKGTSERYAQAFRNYGIDVEQQSPEVTGNVLAQSAVRDILLAGLHDWMRLASTGDQGRLSAILENADNDSWRHAFRTAALANDVPSLKELSTRSGAVSQPPVLQFWLASALQSAGVVNEAQALLRYGQQQHPEDFWLNFQLGMVLTFGKEKAINSLERPEQDAVGYFRAAVAIRPASAIAHNYLGVSLGRTRQLDSALMEFRTACKLDPTYAVPHSNLGLALSYKGDVEGAVTEYRQAIKLDSSYALAHNNLANLLSTCKDPQFHDPLQAVMEARRAVELKPDSGMYWNTLGEAYHSAGQWEQAIVALEKSIALKTNGDSEDFFFLAMSHWHLGHKVEALASYQKGIDWMEKNDPKNNELLHFRADAAKLLGVKE